MTSKEKLPTPKEVNEQFITYIEVLKKQLMYELLGGLVLHGLVEPANAKPVGDDISVFFNKLHRDILGADQMRRSIVDEADAEQSKKRHTETDEENEEPKADDSSPA